MSSHGNKNKIALILAIPAIIALVIAPFGLKADEKDDLEAQKTAKQQQLDALNAQIKAYNAEIVEIKKQSASLNNEIRLFDIEIKSTELQIQAANTNIDNTTIQIVQTEEQIKQRTEQIEKEKKVLSELLLELHQYDATSALQISLGTSSFSEFMDQMQYTESMQERVFTLLKQIKEIKARLEKDQKDLEVNLEKLNELKGTLSAAQESLGSQKEAKVVLLNQTRGQESRYKTLVAATEAEHAKIHQEIYELESKLRGQTGFKALPPIKGILAWPMDGIMTQKYGNTGFTALGYNFHNGIDLAAPAGTSIYAAGDGVVEAVGRGEGAYGNWVVIRHKVGGKLTQEILTLYAHMISYRVSPGQEVKMGDLIGYEGNTGNTTRLIYGPERGYHLHFTVFDANGFGIADGAHQKTYGPYKVPYGYTYNPLDFF